MKIFEKKKLFSTLKKIKIGQAWYMIQFYHMDESVIPRMKIYTYDIYTIIGVIVHGHVINIYIYMYHINATLYSNWAFQSPP